LDDDAAYPPKWVGGYTPVAPRPAPATRRRVGCLPIVAGVSGLALVALLMVGAFLASGVQLAGLNLASATSRSSHSGGAAPGARPTATVASPCVVAKVSAAASQALRATQLSTGISSSDPEHLDLRPVGSTSSFTVGQVVYVTFQFTTNQAGTVRGEFCANDMSGDNMAIASKAVSSGLRDGRGEFHLCNPLARSNIGLGVVTLYWNGAVAAVLTYTVKSSQYGGPSTSPTQPPSQCD
ncbi:MAG TPA: hypothetical protein VGR57_12685, partial [Ktedonobacterales bacterium]|nr:hypothetical protein [Ktedonobacterales bacterium]